MTAAPGWPGPHSPYHAGEKLAQHRAGVAERAERMGWRVIRAAMPDQHRELFTELPYLVLGGVDAAGWPRASIVAGPAGFVQSPDPRTLAIAALPGAADPLGPALGVGAPVGILGIQLATRRRNRANGVVAARDGAGFAVEIRQSFGNCPRFIQARAPAAPAAPAALPTPATAAPAEADAAPRGPDAPRIEGAALSVHALELVRQADTMFIASATPDAGHGDGSDGVDVSHRGGRPGFLSDATGASGATVITMPDYSGNNMFATVGNLLREPRAGLVIPDFATGGLLSLAVTAEIVWDGPEVTALEGAERIVRYRVHGGTWLPRRIAAAWTPPVFAPELAP